MKKALKITGITLLSIILIIGAAAGIFFVTYQATVSFDFAEKTGAVKKGASGYLYGIAENGVPSAEMVESLDIQTVSQKVSGGLQHPVGDIDAADKMLKDVKYEVVYLQDVYDTWYYKHDDIMTLRGKGEYDWQAFINNDYLPKVEKTVKNMSEKSYKAPIVYCLYNECDNGIWFGESVKDENPDNQYGVWCDYNDKGKDNFNLAWKQTYDLVRSLDKNALIGGPGFCDYDLSEIRYFLEFCKNNNCLPDVMIYHELAERESFDFEEHIRSYRFLENELLIDPLEIIITEYGMMSENGYPGEMIKYITHIENSKVYADNAYWRLADNLNDNCADANSPNAQWWLMRWYTDMKGETVKGTNKDILSSDFANYIKYRRTELGFNGFMGIASTDGKEIDVVCGGGERKSRVQLKSLDSTELYGKEVEITVEETVYKGLYGAVSKPVTVNYYVTKLKKSLTVELGKVDSANAYHIVIKEKGDTQAEAESRPVRYEFENGTLLGKAYTYDSYCPASGGNAEGHDLVGGMENEGDGVEISIDIPSDGSYSLDFIYGNSNDGGFLENGRQDPDGRVNTKVNFSLDGKQKDILELPNTIKSEYTSCYSVPFEYLEKGEHKVRLEHVEGTFVLDSLVVSPDASYSRIAVLPDADRTTEKINSYLAVVPQDGYYTVSSSSSSMSVNNTEIVFTEGAARVSLKRGLNFLDLASDGTLSGVVFYGLFSENPKTESYIPRHISCSDGAERVIEDEEKTEDYIDGISSNGGMAQIKYTAEKDGVYFITFEYSNNEEGGVHDYNVDLIERYITVSVNGKEQGNVYCRNTYSWQTRKTVTFSAELKKGDNTIVFSNNGAVRFNKKDAFAPRIYCITVSPVQM